VLLHPSKVGGAAVRCGAGESYRFHPPHGAGNGRQDVGVLLTFTLIHPLQNNLNQHFFIAIICYYVYEHRATRILTALERPRVLHFKERFILLGIVNYKLTS
jgi:hypothetical protein